MAVVLLIENDALQARWIHDNLRLIGHSVLWTHNEWDSLLTIHRVHPDLIIIDDTVAQAIQLLSLIRALRGICRTPVLFFTSNTISQYYCEKLSISNCMDKPVDAGQLVHQVQNILNLPCALPAILHGVL